MAIAPKRRFSMWNGLVVEGSQVRFNSEGGGMIVDADENSTTFEFWTMSGVLIDSFTITH